MIFSSVNFLFLFLPLVLGAYFLVPRFAKNLVLLVASLLFYFWGAWDLFFLIIVSILIDYICGWGQAISLGNRGKRVFLFISIVANLGLLVFFKYSNFLIDNINILLRAFGANEFSSLGVALPIGISFYTFQTISYQIDLYRGDVEHQRNLLDFSLFVSLFPQLVAGPIVRYREIQSAIKYRVSTLSGFSYGMTRFIIGLAKKVYLADKIGIFVNYAFSRPYESLSFSVAWLGAIAFTLQVYFDFAAYSDMAIGLGKIFGFDFPENFRYPLTARSIREFWQRWHMTLTRWFRDYVYKPLRDLPGGRSVRDANTFFVFLLVGLWHGASWTFILWGAYHGGLLVLERKGLAKVVKKWPVALQHFYVLFLVVLSAVFFRGNSLSQASDFLFAMSGFNQTAKLDPLFFVYFNKEFVACLLLASIASTPLGVNIWRYFSERNFFLPQRGAIGAFPSIASAFSMWLFFLFVAGAVISTSKTPFIYFRF